MKPRTTLIIALAGAALVASTALFTPGCTCPQEVRPAVHTTTVAEHITYRGWTNALRLTSKEAEVIVVPEVGRVMSFRFRNGKNVFWEDPSLGGQRGNPAGKEWINFGGDKTWPAPEADWGKHTGRKEWMPPAAFDALPVEGRIDGHTVVLTSPVDPHFGVRTIRRIFLLGAELQITTTYERVSGEPSKIGVWVITQFKEPVAVCLPVASNSIFSDGHYKFGTDPWPQVRRQGDHLEITRDPKAAHKLGSDAHKLVWVGEKEMCVITTWPRPGSEYPDRGASAEVYTNPDPKQYVELETLGPLSLLKPGESISSDQQYSLYRRTVAKPEEEWVLKNLGH